jgi:SAM-dependent methyltransferase
MLREIVERVIQRFLPPVVPPAAILEICCGDGQLRAWLPRPLHGNILHTDFSPALLEELQRRFPNAAARCADVYQLPLGDSTQAAVMGLCAFDSLNRQDIARNEIHRVLAPRGKFIHFLDMQANPEPLFIDLVGRGEAPLPNFLEDRLLLESLTTEDRGRLPTTGVMDDFLAIPRASLVQLLAFLARTASPLAQTLTPFVQRFDPQNFDSYGATAALMSLLANPQKLPEVNRALLSLLLAFGGGQHREINAFSVRPVSSVAFVRRVFEDLFGPDQGFEIEMSDIITHRRARRREPGMPVGARFHLRCVGKADWRADAPERSLGQPLEAIAGISDEGAKGRQPPPGDDEVVIETGIYVFVASKRPAPAEAKG